MSGHIMHMAYIMQLEEGRLPVPVPPRPRPVPPPEIFTLRVVLPPSNANDDAMAIIAFLGLHTESELLPILVNGKDVRESDVDGVDIDGNMVYLAPGDRELTYLVQIDTMSYVEDEAGFPPMYCFSVGLPFTDVYIESFGHAFNCVIREKPNDTNLYRAFWLYYVMPDGEDDLVPSRLHVNSWHNAPDDVMLEYVNLVSVPESWSSLPRKMHGLYIHDNDALASGGTMDAGTVNLARACFSNCPNWKFDAYGMYRRLASIGRNPDLCTQDFYEDEDYYYGVEGCFARSVQGIGWDRVPIRWGGGGDDDNMERIMDVRFDFTPHEGVAEPCVSNGWFVSGDNGILNIAINGNRQHDIVPEIVVWDEKFFDCPGLWSYLLADRPSSYSIQLANVKQANDSGLYNGLLFYLCIYEESSSEDIGNIDCDIHFSSFGGVWTATSGDRSTLKLAIETDSIIDPDRQIRVHIDSWTGLAADNLQASASRVHSIPDSWEGIHDDAWIDLSGNKNLVSGGVTGIEKSGITYLDMSGCVNWEGDAYAIYECLSKRPGCYANFSGCTKAAGWDRIPVSWGGGKSETVMFNGTQYKVISACRMLWMAENLQEFPDLGEFYNDDETTYGRGGKNYGRLYSGHVIGELAKRIDEVPGNDGWRLPAPGEFDFLVGSLGEGSGTKLKSAIGWVAGEGTDDIGFDARPAGGWDDGYFGDGSETRFWSMAVGDDGEREQLKLDDRDTAVVGFEYNDYCQSVRLVKDLPCRDF